MTKNSDKTVLFIHNSVCSCQNLMSHRAAILYLCPINSFKISVGYISCWVLIRLWQLYWKVYIGQIYHCIDEKIDNVLTGNSYIVIFKKQLKMRRRKQFMFSCDPCHVALLLWCKRHNNIYKVSIWNDISRLCLLKVHISGAVSSGKKCPLSFTQIITFVWSFVRNFVWKGKHSPEGSIRDLALSSRKVLYSGSSVWWPKCHVGSGANIGALTLAQLPPITVHTVCGICLHLGLLIFSVFILCVSCRTSSILQSCYVVNHVFDMQAS